MKRQEIIAELERLAELLGVEIRYERMGILPGGLCRVEQEMILLVNKSLSHQSVIELLTEEISKLQWNKHFVKPEVREILEKKKQTISLNME